MSASHAAHLTKTVLIADDDPVYREVGREALAHRRYGVSVAADGGQALKALAEHKFNLAIIDLTMPVADGITVIARTRAQGPNMHTPIIVITGHDDETAVTRAYQAGATSFMTKPINWVLFAHHVEFVMRSGETEQELREATTATAYLSDLKSQMATALAREFQGPIKTVLGFAELIRREVYGPLVPSTYRDLAGDMATATQQLNASLLKLMDFGRTLTANLDVKSETLRIGDLISDAMSALEHNALRRDVAIDVNLQIPADLTLCADRALLIQAIRAVIGNAVNMSPRGSRVEISAALDEDGQFNLWARDRGPDIPTSLLAEINETDRKRAMLQRQPTESREIGIKIAKILTEAHQGRLDARSDQSGGNVVRLELPRERVLGGTDVPTPQSRENERARLAAVSAALAADPRLAALTTMPSATITTSTPSRPR